MRQTTRDRRARQLRQAAGDDNMLTLEQAMSAVGVGIIATRAILKELMVAGANIPAILGYRPNFKRVRRALQYGQRQNDPAYPIPTAPPQEGKGLKVEPEPFEAVIWPPRAGLPRKAKFYRLR